MSFQTDLQDFFNKTSQVVSTVDQVANTIWSPTSTSTAGSGTGSPLLTVGFQPSPALMKGLAIGGLVLAILILALILKD